MNGGWWRMLGVGALSLSLCVQAQADDGRGGRGGPGGERGVAHGQPGPGRGEAYGGSWGPHPDWRPGRVVEALPRGHLRVPYRGGEYFFLDGYWYRPDGPRYVLVVPPRGVRVRSLPPYAEQVWLGSVLYFLAAGTYYLWHADTREYEVVSPPPRAAGPVYPVSGPAASYDVVAYPARGQGPDQQGRDRYECHRWAVGESGFDPAGATYAPAAEVANGYRRAMAACLSGRGYSVN